jgi:hypothetical protein
MTALVAKKKEKSTTNQELKHHGDRIKYKMLAGRNSSIWRIEKDFDIRRHLGT